MAILEGRTLATEIRNSLSERVSRCDGRPKLSVVLVGENPASLAYVRQKRRACEEVGMEFELVELSENASTKNVLDVVRDRNNDSGTHAIIVQLPLPAHVDRNAVVDAISPEKDVDGFTQASVSGIFLNRQSGFVPCTPKGILRLLSHYGILLE